jgi:uncharacterized membrane protein YbhN (UPF0104 family)
METVSRVPQGRRPYARQSGVAAIGLLISAIAMIVVAGSVDLEGAAKVLVAASIGPLAIALVLILVSLGIRVVLRRALLPARDDRTRVSLLRVLPVVLVAYLGNAVLPARLGEVIGAYLMAARERLSFAGALGAVAMERVLDIASLATIAFAAALVAGSPAWVVQGTGLLAAVGIAVVAILATTGLRPLVGLLGRLSVIGMLKPVVAIAVRGLEPFVYWSGGSHRRSAMLFALALATVTWLCNAAVFWLASGAVGADLSFPAALLVMAVTVLATAIPSAPSYVGTFELATVAIATSLGVAADTALAVAILTHALGVVPSAVGGAVALAWMGGSLQGLSRAAEEERLAEVASPPPRVVTATFARGTTRDSIERGE